jgi:hypothetical protein
VAVSAARGGEGGQIHAQRNVYHTFNPLTPELFGTTASGHNRGAEQTVQLPEIHPRRFAHPTLRRGTATDHA